MNKERQNAMKVALGLLTVVFLTTPAIGDSETTVLDSSSAWKCGITGACSKGGLCCPDGAKKHLKGVQNIKSIEVDTKAGQAILSITEGKSVNVNEIKKALGNHWNLKACSAKTEG